MENPNTYILGLVDSGLSVIPVTEGAKNPHRILGAKHDLLDRRATHEEVEKWLAAGVTSWGVAGGSVSDNLVVLDFDEKHYKDLYDCWYNRLADDQKAIVATCVLSKTRNNGKHLRYRTETPRPTEKLSRRVIDGKIETTSETKAQGGYALIPPSAGYEFLHGDLEHLPIVGDEMHESLIDILRTFEEVEEEPATEYEWKPGDTTFGDRPGDRFNALASWEEILKPYGWVEEYKDHWRRPGKKDGEGISATTGYAGVPMLYVFSTAAAPFSANKGYSKFHALALLKHGGDFKAAARTAAEMYLQTAYTKIATGNGKGFETGGKKSKPQAMTVCMADVQPEPISWLWPGRIALGKLTLIAGDPGLGKSLLTATMAATVSKGYTWPLTDSASPIGSVVLLSAEDDPADTIRPRLDAAEADCERIHVLQAIRDIDAEGKPTQRMFSFKRDLAALEERLSSLPDCKLLIIDPVSAYLDGTDSHNNTDVRGLLAPLAKLAADNDIAVVLVQHLNKSSGNSAMYRAIGSVAFIAAARAAYVVTKDQKNPERRLVMPVKNNLAKDSTGLAYSILTAENGAPVIAWELEPVTITADEALTPSDSNEEKTDTEWAIEVLEIALANGPKPVIEINKEARQAGISPKSLRTAREKLGVKPKKVGFNAGWVWSLPQHEDASKGEDALSGNEGALGVEGHLGVK